SWNGWISASRESSFWYRVNSPSETFIPLVTVANSGNFGGSGGGAGGVVCPPAVASRAASPAAINRPRAERRNMREPLGNNPGSVRVQWVPYPIKLLGRMGEVPR